MDAIVKKQLDRRKHRRLRTRLGAYVALLPDAIVLGPIINISAGGLAFQYFNDDRSRKKNSTELAIFMSGSRFYLGSVPFRTITDVVQVNENPFSSISMRICGIQFGDLSLDQQRQLTHFLSRQTQKDRE